MVDGGAINVLVFRLETLTTNNFGILLRNILGLLFLLLLLHFTSPINEKHTLKWRNTTMVWCDGCSQRITYVFIKFLSSPSLKSSLGLLVAPEPTVLLWYREGFLLCWLAKLSDLRSSLQSFWFLGLNHKTSFMVLLPVSARERDKSIFSPKANEVVKI